MGWFFLEDFLLEDRDAFGKRGIALRKRHCSPFTAGVLGIRPVALLYQLTSIRRISRVRFPFAPVYSDKLAQVAELVDDVQDALMSRTQEALERPQARLCR